MANSKSKNNETEKTKEEVREDQLLKDKDKTDAELKTLDAAQDEKDGKGDPEALEKEASRDREAAGIYHLKEDDLIRHLSALHKGYDDHEMRLKAVETKGSEANPNVAPVDFTASDMIKLLDQMVRERLMAHEIRKDFTKNYPKENIADTTRKLSQMGLDFQNPAHAAFIENLSVQENPGKLYKQLSERPEVVTALSELHPMFHQKAMDELKTGIKGRVDNTPQDKVDNAVDNDVKELKTRHDQEGDLIRQIYGRK